MIKHKSKEKKKNEGKKKGEKRENLQLREMIFDESFLVQTTKLHEGNFGGGKETKKHQPQ